MSIDESLVTCDYITRRCRPCVLSKMSGDIGRTRAKPDNVVRCLWKNHVSSKMSPSGHTAIFCKSALISLNLANWLREVRLKSQVSMVPRSPSPDKWKRGYVNIKRF